MLLTDNPKFASICQFFHLFDFNLVLSNLSDKLEEELTTPTYFLKELVVKLLKNFYKSRNTRLTLQNMLFYCCKEMRIKNCENVAIYENASIEQLDPLQRLDLMYFLTELQLDGHDWKYLRIHEDLCTGWRVEPIGKDSYNSKYWLFDDSRLYREFDGEISSLKVPTIPKIVDKSDQNNNYNSNSQLNTDAIDVMKLPKLKLILRPPSVQPPVQPWKLVCKSTGDWYNILKLFENSTHSDEMLFYSTLVRLVPLVVEDIRKKRRESKVRALIDESNQTLTATNSAILEEDISVKEEEFLMAKRKSRNSMKVELNFDDIEVFLNLKLGCRFENGQEGQSSKAKIKFYIEISNLFLNFKNVIERKVHYSYNCVRPFSYQPSQNPKSWCDYCCLKTPIVIQYSSLVPRYYPRRHQI